jgi:hypothetical protein
VCGLQRRNRGVTIEKGIFDMMKKNKSKKQKKSSLNENPAIAGVAGQSRQSCPKWHKGRFIKQRR